MVRVHLLDRVAVEVDGEPVVLPPGRPTELLAWLAAHPGMHARTRLAPIFWPDVLDSTARASLRTALWALRRALGPAGDEVLRIERNAVGLEGDALHVDLREAASSPLTAPVRDVLPGIEGEWADEARADHRRRIIEALTAIDRTAAASGDRGLGLEVARRLADIDPFSDELHRRLVQRLAEAGELGAVRREHDQFRRRLWDELQVRPAAETRELVARLTASGPEGPAGGPAATVAALAAATAPSAPLVVPPRLARLVAEPCIGRGAERAALLDVWSRVARGTGPLAAMVEGEAGIGKTLLAAHFAAEAVDGGATVMFGSASEDQLVPAEPFLEAIGEHLVVGPEQLVEIVRERVSHALAAGPAVLVLDDFHWADSVSFAVLRRLVRVPAAARLGLVVLARSDGDAQEKMAALAADLHRHAELARIRLGPLTADATATLLAELDPKGTLSPRAGAIHVETGGNPLFVREVGRYLLETPADWRLSSPVPDSVRDLVVTRLRGLSDAAAEVMATTAVLGARAEHAVVSHMTTSGIDVLRAFEEAVAAGLLDEVDVGLHNFRHALVRDAVYETLSKSRRAELHRRAADAIRAVHGDDGLHLCDIADHRCAATPPDSPVAAVTEAQRAGAWAIEHQAYDRAVVLLTKAIPLAEGTAKRDLTVQRAIAYQRLYHMVIDQEE